MKFELFESGLQNIKNIAKQYNKAEIYFHIDLDGVTSAIAMKEYLKRYGIVTVGAQKIQYGGMEYAISKPKSDDILPVLVDFAHGKAFMKIHTDHHDKQIEYKGVSNQFRHAKSNAETISSIISVSDIFPKEDIRIISMIDSAGFKEEDVNRWDMNQAVVKYDNKLSGWRNHLNMGMSTGKLLLTYKNKPNFLETVVLKAEPSLVSMYNVMMGMINQHIANNDRGWTTPEEIEKNSKEYYNQQLESSIEPGFIEDIDKMTNGQSALINDSVIFQVGGGYMGKTGSYDRYTAFRLYPKAKYFIMLWNTIGMMQISKNPWGDEEKDIHLGHIVMDGIFKNKYEKYLKKPKYNISLLAIKQTLESNLNIENEESAIGFDYEELMNLFNHDFSFLSEKQQYAIKKAMSMKPSQLVSGSNNPKQEKIIKTAIGLMSKLWISLPEIIEKTSGGHPAITNISGFAFLDQQQAINRALKQNKNPYGNKVEDEDSPLNYGMAKPFIFGKNDTTSTKILKSIAKDVIKKLS